MPMSSMSKSRYENIAGVEIPIFDKVVFREPEYFLFDTPVWTDRATEILRELVTVTRKNQRSPGREEARSGKRAARSFDPRQPV